MKNIKFTILGVATLLFALTLNFRHALDDYGVLDNKLHVEVLAQSNTTDGGSTTDGGGSNNNGGNIYHYEHLKGKPKTCTLNKYIKAGAEAVYSEDTINLGGEWTHTQVSGIQETCPDQGSGCTVYSCHVTNNTGGGTT